MSIQDPHPTIDRPEQHPTAEQLPLIRVSQQYQRHIPWLINERAVEMAIRKLGLREPIGSAANYSGQDCTAHTPTALSRSDEQSADPTRCEPSLGSFHFISSTESVEKWTYGNSSGMCES